MGEAGWTELGAAWLVFALSHAIPARPAVRRRLVRGLGEPAYLGLYVAVSLATLAWLIAAAGRAPYVELWAFAPWQLWVPNLVMPIACLLIAYGAGAVNPLSFAGRAPERFDPDAPGMAGVVRHPLLWALLLWSGSHLAPNGDLAHLLLFGGMAAMAAGGMVAIDRRLQRRWGMAEWRRLARRTSSWPLGAFLTGAWRPAGPPEPWRLVLALALYVTLLLGHAAVIGVSPLPLSVSLAGH